MALLWLWYGVSVGGDFRRRHYKFLAYKMLGALVGFYVETHFELILGMRVLGVG